MWTNLGFEHTNQLSITAIGTKDNRHITRVDNSTSMTPGWQGLDSNLRFRAKSHMSHLVLQKKQMLSWMRTRLQECHLLDDKEGQDRHPGYVYGASAESPSQEDLSLLPSTKWNHQLKDGPHRKNCKETPAVDMSPGDSQGLPNCCSRQDELSKSVAYAIDNLNTLIFSKDGSLTIRRLLHCSEAFYCHMLQYAVLNLKRLSIHDHPCRVLRAVLRTSEAMRQKVLIVYAQDFKFCLNNFHSIFLLTEAIRLSKNSQEFNFVVAALAYNSQSLMASRYYKTILLTVIQACSKGQLRVIESCLNLTSRIHLYLNDSISVSLLVSLIRRECSSCIKAFLIFAEQRPHLLLNLKHSHQFFLKMAEQSTTSSSGAHIRQAFGQLLTTMCANGNAHENLRCIKESSRDLFLAYCFLLTHGEDVSPRHIQAGLSLLHTTIAI